MAAYLELSVHLRDSEDNRKSIELIDIKLNAICYTSLLDIVTHPNPEAVLITATQLQESYFPASKEKPE